MDNDVIIEKLKEFRRYLVYQATHQETTAVSDFIEGWEMGSGECLREFDKIFKQIGVGGGN